MDRNVLVTIFKHYGIHFTSRELNIEGARGTEDDEENGRDAHEEHVYRKRFEKHMYSYLKFHKVA